MIKSYTFKVTPNFPDGNYVCSFVRFTSLVDKGFKFVVSGPGGPRLFLHYDGIYIHYENTNPNGTYDSSANAYLTLFKEKSKMDKYRKYAREGKPQGVADRCDTTNWNLKY